MVLKGGSARFEFQRVATMEIALSRISQMAGHSFEANTTDVIEVIPPVGPASAMVLLLKFIVIAGVVG